MSIEAMKQALGYMDGTLTTDHLTGYERKRFVMAALRQAIEQAEKQEPCCYAGLNHDCHAGPNCRVVLRLKRKVKQAEQAQPVAWLCMTEEYSKIVRFEFETFGNVTPLYTAPPPRQPLTDEEIKQCWVAYRAALPRYLCFARAIEAAHGIKEKT